VLFPRVKIKKATWTGSGLDKPCLHQGAGGADP